MKVDDWEDIPEDEVNPTNQQLYDSPHRATRQQVDLATYPVKDAKDSELRVYLGNGLRLPRRHPLCDPEEKPSAVLMNLLGIQSLFEDPALTNYDPAFEEDPAPQVTVNAYRQCGFKSIGHIQANRVPLRMNELIDRMNARLADVIETEDEDNPPVLGRAIRGVDCQFYNAAMHRVRGTADTHDAQRGDITAALAGSYSVGPSQKRTAERLRDACNVRLPHQNFNHLINHDDLDVSIRAECVFNIDIPKLKTRHRGAACVRSSLQFFIAFANT